MKNYPRILFFINGTLPTFEAQEIAETMGPNVAFRNARFVPTSGAPEKCDGVAGEVPELYKKMPTATEAIEVFEKKRIEAIQTAKENAKKRKEASKANAEAQAKAVEDLKKSDAKAAAKAKQTPKAPAPAPKQAASVEWKPNA